MAAAFRTVRFSAVQACMGLALALLCTGCAIFEKKDPPPSPPPRVLVVPPVRNLSGTKDFDPLAVTDILASELISFENVSVVPVNLTLAELVRRGQASVETPEDARELAEVFSADGTLVVAVTEYDPYDPPVVGLVMQYYPTRTVGGREAGLHPVTASRAMAAPEVGPRSARQAAEMVQVQRVFNAADEAVLEEVREYADARERERSPYGWRKWIKSQELYVRYSLHALIRTMLSLHGDHEARLEPTEA